MSLCYKKSDTLDIQVEWLIMKIYENGIYKGFYRLDFRIKLRFYLLTIKRCKIKATQSDIRKYKAIKRFWMVLYPWGLTRLYVAIWTCSKALEAVCVALVQLNHCLYALGHHIILYMLTFVLTYSFSMHMSQCFCVLTFMPYTLADTYCTCFVLLWGASRVAYMCLHVLICVCLLASLCCCCDSFLVINHQGLMYSMLCYSTHRFITILNICVASICSCFIFVTDLYSLWLINVQRLIKGYKAINLYVFCYYVLLLLI